MKTQGNPLIAAKSPKVLMVGIMYAMVDASLLFCSANHHLSLIFVGHWELLKAGWLHCDVNIDNILLLPKNENRKPIAEYAFYRPLNCFIINIEYSFHIPRGYFQKCIAFIIDADWA